MHTSTVFVSGLTLPYIQYQDTPVVTTSMIDAVHQRPKATARKRFNDNRRHFIEGEDFYLVDLKSESVFRTRYPTLFPEMASKALLFTETGYLMLVKSFTDDLAWKVQRQLVKSYFRTKASTPSIAPPIPEPLDHRQRAQLDDAVRKAFFSFDGYSGSASRWFYNAVRTEYHLKDIHDLPADALPEVLARLQRHEKTIHAYHDLARRMKEQFLSQVIGEGTCWTAWLSNQVGGQQKVGRRPNWKQLAQEILQKNDLLPTKH